MIKFEWQFGQPIHKEDKGDWKGLCLDEWVEKIVGNTTLEELLLRARPTVHYTETQLAKLKITKLSNLVWQVGYYTYKDAGARNFEEMAIEYENAPDLRLALWNIEEKVKNYK